MSTQLVREAPSNFQVSTDAYRDEGVFRLEMERIFYRSWIYLGHDSEIANPGDFKSTWIGRQPVILVRDGAGNARAFLNFCRHRGAALCRTEYGSTKVFVCPYHGWSYRTSGELLGLPDRARYPADFSTADKGLIAIAKVAVYGGLIFGSLNAGVEPLEHYLGVARAHIDLWLARAAGGKYRVTRPHKYAYPGNWKFQCENAVDGYHVGIVHKAALATFRKHEFGEIKDVYKEVVHSEGVTRGFPGGHSTLEYGEPMLQGAPPETVRAYIERIERISGAGSAGKVLGNRHILLFPSVVILDANIRIIQPMAVDQTDVYSYCVQIDGAEAELNAARMNDVQMRMGTMGLVSMEDIEVFGANQTGQPAVGMEWLVLSRGMGREEGTPQGELIGAYSDEVPQRAFWRRWKTMMDVPNERNAYDRDAAE